MKLKIAGVFIFLLLLAANPVQAQNNPPVANAGPDVNNILEFLAVCSACQYGGLDGTASFDPDPGDTAALSFSWLQIAGTPALVFGPTSSTPFLVLPDVPVGGDTLTFELTVTDPGGLFSTDTMDITVRDQTNNTAPIPDAGSNQTVVSGATVQLDASGSSDPDGDVLNFQWTQPVGPAVTLSNAFIANPEFTAPPVAVPTDLTFEVIMCDGFLCDTASVTITILQPELTIYNAGDDLAAAELSGAGEPSLPVNDTWTYGTSDTLGGTFTPFPNPWHTDSFVNGDPSVFQGWTQPVGIPSYLLVNTTNGPASGDVVFMAGVGDFDSHTLWVHPRSIGDPIAFVVLRWTAPADGIIDITADWVRRHFGNASTHVRKNGVLLGTDSMTMLSPVNFVLSSVSVSADDTIDFITGPNGNFSSDSTQLNAIIQFTPTLDKDGDGVLDDIDNCPSVSNADQLDTNGDGHGDACVPPDVNIPPNADIGEGTTVGTGSVINSGVLVGDNSEIGDDATLNKDIIAGENLFIGDGSEINKNSTAGNDVIIGDNVVIGQNVTIGSRVTIGSNTFINRDVVIEDDVLIGVGVTIGRGSIILAGAFVSDGTVLPKNSIVSP